ncbi:hypothetical protein TGPRC2_289720 [Toxoplasma gondii TgCatPRC2]|uniref:Uncharacterized protein n=14 Tax=Toxoplasma gondii TaxID=5811 RepID=A0A125YUG0_TOXGV|nr:hypothetical protein TGME49_289720 [Toxoplasma gondii ME49]EPR59735.1 hypothetical protein TGGT1_289720 [Toxoplasma gondii GT1]ESS33692.1 hypothetical protein TGVEG_289720 [Toxoplasma gondii VEG]KFG33304.1 hypothetical protein TGP89_289720 [Toxoplasma gondii p89]KFG42529.1 hypothetical protein TGDOM2_289720 [Toxoplasma gondii GAB2-2007-GAL-DOM2]KFG53327.1 hypothetical protein TGFOU_289720 [Toxoplasma gondii FOU]KFG62695.1 hypothetical protein TGRUB_289720 [Toxoplasma gondii RUB]KFH07397.1|eukprot:XP_018636415.1 hypothetical protein TGME49_289720 [Toxoplasma gondii ME49]
MDASAVQPHLVTRHVKIVDQVAQNSESAPFLSSSFRVYVHSRAFGFFRIIRRHLPSGIRILQCRFHNAGSIILQGERFCWYVVSV